MSEPTQTTVVWLTQAKYDELKAELEELRGPTRSALVKRVSDARDEGDLKENAGYHAARDELGKLDGRIAQLTQMLERAKVGETPADDGVVEPGMKVTINLIDHDMKQEFLFGAREMAGDELKVFSPQSPLGEAINGKQKQSRSDYTQSEDDNALVTGVAGDKDALGYFGFAYYEENKDKIKIVPVDSGGGCVTPSKETILDGTYKPLSRPLFIYPSTKALQRPEFAAFVKYYLDNVNSFVDEVGYIEASADVLKKSQDALAAATK